MNLQNTTLIRFKGSHKVIGLKKKSHGFSNFSNNQQIISIQNVEGKIIYKSIERGDTRSNNTIQLKKYVARMNNLGISPSQSVHKCQLDLICIPPPHFVFYNQL